MPGFAFVPRSGLWLPYEAKRQRITKIRSSHKGPTGVIRTNPGSSPAPALSGISRDIVSAAGGDSVTIYGSNLETASVTVGGTACTITAQASTILSFTTPAKAVNAGYDVTVSTSGGSATLTAALEYGPAPTTVFAQADFEDGTTGGFTKSASASVVTEARFSGTKSLKCSSAVNTNSSLNKSFGNNPARAEANGCWTRWFVMLPQATIDALVTGQIKLYLHRFGDFGDHPNDKHGIMLGTGLEFRGNTVAAFVDYGIHNTSGINPITGLPFTNGNTGVPFVNNQWVEILQHEWHDGVTTGHMSVWLNGKRCIYNFQHADLFGNDHDSTGALATDSYGIRMGIAFTQNAASYPVVVYVDNAWAGNGVPPVVVPDVTPPAETIYFSDDFSSGDISKTADGWLWNGPEGNFRVSVVSGFSKDGAVGKCVKFTFPGGGDDQAQLAFTVGTPGLKTLWIDFWIYYPDGTEIIGGVAQPAWDRVDGGSISNNNKFYALYKHYTNAQGDALRRVFETWMPYPGSSITVEGQIRGGWRNQCNTFFSHDTEYVYSFERADKRGIWRRVQIGHVMESAYNVGDGHMEFWTDDRDGNGPQKRFEKSGYKEICNTGAGTNQWNYGYLLGFRDAGETGQQYCYISNVRFSDVRLTD